MRLNQVISLSQFIADQQSKHKEATGDLSKIFRDIKFAAKIVNRDVRKAGLVDILGAFGTVNVQGEEVKKLDMLANEEFKSSLTLGGDCCAIISEEEEEVNIPDIPEPIKDIFNSESIDEAIDKVNNIAPI